MGRLFRNLVLVQILMVDDAAIIQGIRLLLTQPSKKIDSVDDSTPGKPDCGNDGERNRYEDGIHMPKLGPCRH